MNNEHGMFNFEFKRGYDKEIYDKLEESEGWVKSLRKSLQNKDYKQVNNSLLVDNLLSCLGYFCIVRDKLKDEIVFNKDTLRSLNLQIKRLEKDLPTRRSELECQVELRDSAVKEFTSIQEKKEKADKSLPDYLSIQENYYTSKKKKESAEQDLRRNALVYQNVSQAIELMKVSSEQGDIYLQQGRKVLEKVEKTLEEMMMVYNAVTIILQAKQERLKITGGENDTKR